MNTFSQIELYSDGDVDTNQTTARPLESIVAERFSRRQTIRGGLMATSTAVLGTTLLAACGDDDMLGGDDFATVDAGKAITTSSGRAVVLGGTTAGNPSSIQTEQIAGPPVTLSGANTANAAFIAPAVTQDTTLSFRITATAPNGNQSIDTTNVIVRPAQLGFTAVAKNRNDLVTVPAGYSVTVMTALGDPIAAGIAAYRNDGTDADFGQRIGDHGDALHFYGLSAEGARDNNSSTRGVLVQNHENLNVQYLHPNGPTVTASGGRPAAEAIKEIEAHGLSFTEYRRTATGWTWVQASTFNRRITPNTPVVFNGPVRGTDFLKTAAAPDGTSGTGTINNCANGVTGWGTNLSCEENWAGYFRRDNSGDGTDNAARGERELTGLRRYGVTSTSGNFRWSSAGTDPVFRRWDARATGASALEDYRNEPNTFGWVIESDPYNPAAAPRKRTALGRMGHEGAWLGRLAAGQKLAVYMGDDSRGEYFYKFVSDAAWSPADAGATDRLAMGDKYLDRGTLYAARFNADGTGIWLPLVFGQVPDRPAVGTTPAYIFGSQADVLVNTRLAADAVRATPMDRPEWTATNPATGEIYLTLTNSNLANRPVNGTDAANPRSYNDPKQRAGFEDSDPNATQAQTGNPNGHIIRVREAGDDPAASSFRWDIYLFGADSAQADPQNVNLSGLTDINDFSSPDGLYFSRATNPAGQVRPLVWIQTDDGAMTDRTYNQMLAGLPGTVGDGRQVTITNSVGDQTGTQSTFVGAPATPATLRRFLTGPNESEVTGVDTTPDGRTLFVGIQHPGEDGEPNAPSSNWPQNQKGPATGRPRSAVVAITKDDGGVIGL